MTELRKRAVARALCGARITAAWREPGRQRRQRFVGHEQAWYLWTEMPCRNSIA